MIKPHFELMANYNAVMNRKISDSLLGVSEDTLWADKKAFFGSILGTINHLMVGDLIWLARFNCHPSCLHNEYPSGFKALASLAYFPSPTTLTQILYSSTEDFINNR